MRKTFYIFILIILASCAAPEPHSEIAAKVEVQFFVESKLRSPLTASFGGQKANKTGEHTYHVEGYVDAQNGFGATIRNYYECDIEFTPNGKQRTIRNFTMM